MSDWLTTLTKDGAQATIIAALLAGIAALATAVVGAIVSYLVARRSVYINSVTAERSKWIEALRDTISRLSGAASKVHERRKIAGYLNSEAWASDIEALRSLLVHLSLRMNPGEPEARHLLRAAKKLDAAARLHSSAALILADEIMTRHAQWVLKAEWERVKEEASGLLSRPVHWYRKWRRRRAYAKFLATDGALDKLDRIGSGEPDSELVRLRSQMSDH